MVATQFLAFSQAIVVTTALAFTYESISIEAGLRRT